MKEIIIKGYEFKDLDEDAVKNLCINIDINSPFDHDECGYTTFKDFDYTYSHVCGRDKYTFDTECIELAGKCVISKHKCDDTDTDKMHKVSATKCKYVTVRENAYDIYQHDPEYIQEFCDINNYLFDVKGNLINHLKELEVSNE